MVDNRQSYEQYLVHGGIDGALSCFCVGAVCGCLAMFVDDYTGTTDISYRILRFVDRESITPLVESDYVLIRYATTTAITSLASAMTGGLIGLVCGAYEKYKDDKILNKIKKVKP